MRPVAWRPHAQVSLVAKSGGDFRSGLMAAPFGWNMIERSDSQGQRQGNAWLLAAIVVLAVGAVVALSGMSERLGLARMLGREDVSTVSESGTAAHGDDPQGQVNGGYRHDDHDHAHEGEDSIAISPQARGNLGLRTEAVKTSTYTRYVSLPATIVDWPGRTHISVTAPLTGVVNAIYISRGELIRSGQPLFSLRLTHQDLVKTQADFLAALGRLDVEQREIQRLGAITESGAVARKALIEREYERDRLQAELRAERQAMLLHGLNERQIGEIEENRKLIREVTVYAPTLHPDNSLHHESESSVPTPSPSLPPSTDPQSVEVQQAAFAIQPDTDEVGHEHLEAEFLVTSLDVNRGGSVSAGESLGQLSDYSSVLIEGRAFQQDAAALRSASKFRLNLQAVIDASAGRPEIVDGLRIAYIGNQIGIESRALPFYVPLQNQIERSEQRGQQRYVSWRYKPGQRLQLRVPVQGYDDTIVVPKDAVAEEGVERYVFVDHGDHFERRSVRVLARDEVSAAIATDGSLRTGDKIAVTGAHQLQMAIKNKSGGTIDPHAGHNH